MLTKTKIDLQMRNFEFLNRVKMPFAKMSNDLSKKVSLYENFGFVKTATKKPTEHPGTLQFPEDFDLKKDMLDHPDNLYVKALAIVADEANDNGDFFSKEELQKSYHTFVGCPLFVNHKNDDVEEARGTIIYAEWSDEENGVMIIGRVDARAYPKLARGISEGYISGVSMGAVSAGTMILMSDFSQKPIEEIKAGDFVISHNGNINEVEFVHGTLVGKEMYKFDLMTYHKSPFFTEEHPILVIDQEQINFEKKESIKKANLNTYNRKKGKTFDFIGQDGWRSKSYSPVFKEAKDIKNGDFLLIPSRFNLEDRIDNDDDFYYLLGAFIGDGYLQRDKYGKENEICFCFGLSETKLHDKIIEIGKKYFKSEPRKIICSERNGMYISFRDEEKAQWILNNIGNGSKNKRLNINIDTYSKASYLLSGYLDTDGCIVNKINQNVRGNKFGGFQISSANISLLEDIQNLLIACDCLSRISTMFRVPSKNSVVKIKTIEHTLSIGSNCYNIFRNSLKYSDSIFSTPIIKAGKSFITTIYNRKYMICPVKNTFITEWNEPVYDLTVKNDESYIADGIAIHNCQVEYSKCSICGNEAAKEEDYCVHIKEHKTRKYNGKDVYEINFGLKFIELSFVVDPACSTCFIQEIYDVDDLKQKVAEIKNFAGRFRKIASKIAGKAELDKLNQAENLIQEVAKTMLDQKEHLELSYVTDLVEALAKLQETKDELLDMGYETLDSSGQQNQQETGLTTTPPEENLPIEKGQNPEEQQDIEYENAGAMPAGEVGSVTMPTPLASAFRKKIMKQAKQKNLSNVFKNSLRKKWNKE